MFLYLAFRNLFRNIRRTIAVLLTVALGAGALFAFGGFIQGVLEEYRDSTIHSHYGYGQIFTKGYRGKAFEDPKKHWIKDGYRLENFLYEQPGVEQVFPRVSFSALLEKGKTTLSGSGQGIAAEREAGFFHGLTIVEGVTLTNQEDGILLGKGLAHSLNAKPGDAVTVMATSNRGIIKKNQFVVTGIFHTGSLDFDSRVFRVPLSAAQRLLRTPNIESVALALKNLSDWGPVAAQVTKNFPGLEATPFDVLDEVYYKHSVDWLRAQFRVVQAIILSIVLLGIFNAISTSILERKQEIGNLRANGEPVSQVMLLIVAEGALLAIIGSLIGLGGSYLALKVLMYKGLAMPPGPGMTNQFMVVFTFSPSMTFYTIMLCTIAAIAASFLAGLRVAKMTIAKCLRSY
jgi:putative ABC transport system permease protein